MAFPNQQDPVRVRQEVDEEVARIPRGLGVAGLDIAFSDTSSGSRLNQQWSRPPSMATSDTREYHRDIDDPTSPMFAGSSQPQEHAFNFPKYGQINGVGSWSDGISPGATSKDKEIELLSSGRMEGFQSPFVHQKPTTIPPNAEESIDAAWLFAEQNFQDVRHGRNADELVQKRLIDCFDILKNSIDGKQPFRCYACQGSTFKSRGTCLRHIQEYHLPQSTFQCSVKQEPKNRVTKQNQKDKCAIARRDKFGEFFSKRFGRKASKEELELYRRQIACPSKCPVCPQPFDCWSTLYNHLLDEHCRRPSIASAATSRSNSIAELNLNTDNGLVSPGSDISSNHKDQNGHLVPPSMGRRSLTSSRGSGSFPAGTSPPARPASNCSDGSISPSQFTADQIQENLPNFNRSRNSQQFPGFPPRPQQPEVPRDHVYAPRTSCTVCRHPISQCQQCQSIMLSVPGLWCHVCIDSATSSVYNPEVPQLHLSTPTPAPENSRPSLYQPPSYQINTTHNRPRSSQQGGQHQRQHSEYNPYLQHRFQELSAATGDDPQVLTVRNIPEPVLTECKPGVFEYKPMSLSCAAPKISLSKGMKEMGKCISDLKDFFIGVPTSVSHAVPPQALERPIVETSRRSPCAAKARVDIGQGETIDMRVRLLPNEKPGHLLRSRVQVVVKLLKLRSSAAESAERRERQKSDTSDWDTTIAAEKSGQTQQSVAEGDHKDDNDDEADEDDEKCEDSRHEEDDQDDERPSISQEESQATEMDSLTASLANQLRLWLPTCLDLDWVEDQSLAEPSKDHEEATLGVYVATDLISCLKNMSNWSGALSELTGFKSNRAANDFFKLFLQHLFWTILALNPSPEFNGKKKLDEK